MVALSVSISARMSPDLTGSPSFLSHLASLPFSIVGDSAGMRILVGMLVSVSEISGRKIAAMNHDLDGAFAFEFAPAVLGARCVVDRDHKFVK